MIREDCATLSAADCCRCSVGSCAQRNTTFYCVIKRNNPVYAATLSVVAPRRRLQPPFHAMPLRLAKQNFTDAIPPRTIIQCYIHLYTLSYNGKKSSIRPRSLPWRGLCISRMRMNYAWSDSTAGSGTETTVELIHDVGVVIVTGS